MARRTTETLDGPKPTYASVGWTAQDVRDVRPDLSEAEAEAFLNRHESHIQDRLTELGWGVLETLLAVDEFVNSPKEE